MPDLRTVDFSGITPEDSPRSPEEVISDPLSQDLMTAKLAPGDPAHDFDLPLHDFTKGVGQETGARFRLSEVAAGRPVALIFGSYT